MVFMNLFVEIKQGEEDPWRQVRLSLPRPVVALATRLLEHCDRELVVGLLEMIAEFFGGAPRLVAFAETQSVAQKLAAAWSLSGRHVEARALARFLVFSLPHTAFPCVSHCLSLCFHCRTLPFLVYFTSPFLVCVYIAFPCVRSLPGLVCFTSPFIVCFHCLTLPFLVCFHCLSLCFHCLAHCPSVCPHTGLWLRSSRSRWPARRQWWRKSGCNSGTGCCCCVITPERSRLLPRATLPLPCASAAVAAETLPLPCVSTAVAAKTVPLPAVLRSHELARGWAAVGDATAASGEEDTAVTVGKLTHDAEQLRYLLQTGRLGREPIPGRAELMRLKRKRLKARCIAAVSAPQSMQQTSTITQHDRIGPNHLGFWL